MGASAAEFERLVGEHKDAVYRQLLRLCGNVADAEDVLSESLLRAFRAIHNLEDSDRFRAWMVQIGRRLCGRLKHHEALHPLFSLEEIQSALPSTPGSAEQAALEGQLREVLHRALEELSPTLRAVYELRDLQERSTEETAGLLGISPAAVKTRLHRARAELRSRIDAELGE